MGNDVKPKTDETHGFHFDEVALGLVDDSVLLSCVYQSLAFLLYGRFL
jgi:hypothetical protein